MKEPLEHIVFYRDLDAEGRTHLRDSLASDPEAAAAFARWRSLREGVRAELEEAVPDSHRLALYALDKSLVDEERRAEMDRALEAHPGLRTVVSDIAGAAAEFDLLWDEWMEKEDKPVLRRERMDRRPARRKSARYVMRGAIAASLILFVAVLALLARRDIQTVTISTSAGETTVVDLGNGSTVRLTENSTFSYVPPEDAGPVDGQAKLRGGAFFQIARGGRGFVVTTESARVTVLGTSFGLRSDGKETQVVLAEGRLTVSALHEPSRSVVLEPGHMSAVGANQVPTPPQRVDVSEHLAWTGLFVFSATPLKQIAERLSEHYGTVITMDPDLAEERVSGTFSAEQSLHEILEVIASTLGAALRSTSSGGYALSPG